MLSTAFFSHHGRFQPGKAQKPGKNGFGGNNKAIGHLVASESNDQIPTLRRYTKFNASTNYNSPPPSYRNAVSSSNSFNSPLTNVTEVRVLDNHVASPIRSVQSSPAIRKDDRRQSVLSNGLAQEKPVDMGQLDTDQVAQSYSPVPARMTMSQTVDSFRPTISSSAVPVRRTNSFNKQNRLNAMRRSSTSSASSSTTTSSNSKSSVVADKSSRLRSPQFQSCPDLLKSCMETNGAFTSNLALSKFSKSEKNLFKRKPPHKWTLDDVLLWLHSVGLEEVTSVLIGYDLTGSDMLQWNDESLESLGIGDETKRARILEEVRKLKMSPSLRNFPKKQHSQKYRSMFAIIRKSCYDRIVVLELSANTSARDFTVATDQMEMALVVTSCKSVAELNKGDLIIELNGISCIKMAPVDFNKLLHKLNGNKYQMVVLRKSQNQEGMPSQLINGENSPMLLHL